MVPSEARERLADGIYKTVEPSNPIGLLQEALVLAQSAEPLEKRIRVEGVKTGRITATISPHRSSRHSRSGSWTRARPGCCATTIAR